jgi:2-phosphosulfolactate phosphatase
LMSRGHRPASRQTADIIRRWRDAPPGACLGSRSVDFLRRTSQLRDLDFVLAHIDDRREVFEVRDGEVKIIQVPAFSSLRRRAPEFRGGPCRPLLQNSQRRL